MVLRGKLSDRHLWVANLRSYKYRVSLHNHLVRRAYSLRASKNRQVAEYGFELSTGRKNHHAPHAAESGNHPDTLYLAVASRGSSPYPGKFSIRPAASPDPERIQTSFRRRPSGNTGRTGICYGRRHSGGSRRK